MLKASKTAMNAFINPPQLPNSGIVIPKGIFVAFITQQSGPGVVQFATQGENQTFTNIYPQKPGDSSTLIVNEGYGSRIAGISALRCFSLGDFTDEVKETDRAIQAYDIYKNVWKKLCWFTSPQINLW